mmetsp:Transcript_58519/g.151229  ORF Transcript_58519/g.151229 Transcript_58519/m.151229 type:complete len:243 (+) Transcript_58519:224-952(+)
MRRSYPTRRRRCSFSRPCSHGRPAATALAGKIRWERACRPRRAATMARSSSWSPRILRPLPTNTRSPSKVVTRWPRPLSRGTPEEIRSRLRTRRCRGQRRRCACSRKLWPRHGWRTTCCCAPQLWAAPCCSATSSTPRPWPPAAGPSAPPARSWASWRQCGASPRCTWTTPTSHHLSLSSQWSVTKGCASLSSASPQTSSGRAAWRRSWPRGTRPLAAADACSFIARMAWNTVPASLWPCSC